MAAEAPGEAVEGLLVELDALLRSFAHGPPLAGETARIGALLRRLARALEAGGHDGACLLASDMALAVESWRAPDDVVLGALERCVRGLAALCRPHPGQRAERRLETVRPITLVNELRALRAAPLLSGNAVVEMDLIDVDTHDPAAASDPDTHHTTGARSHEAPAAARRWRAVYQRGLIAWLRGGEDDGAARITEACDGMASLCHGHPQGRLWEVAAAFAEVLEDRRWRRSAAVKRLLGQLDGQLKRLAAGAALDVPASLVKSLLYYVAVAPEAGPRATATRERYDLARAFTVPRRAGETPDPVAALTLLNELLTVAGALLEPLPAAGGSAERHAMLSGNLLHVADGLSLLGLPALRCEIMEELSLFESTRATGDPPPGGWGEMAERLHACGGALLEAAGMEPAAAFRGDAVPRERDGLLPRRLDADLAHAEEIIRRLETAAPAQGDAGLGETPGGARAGIPAPLAERDSGPRSDAMADAARELSARLARLSAAPASGEPAAAAAPAPEPDAELVDDLLLIAAEVGAARTRLEQQAGALRDGLHGMDRVLRALREELGSLRAQAEPGEEPGTGAPGVGNPVLRARIEGLSRGIAELSELRGVFEDIADEHRAVLGRQARESHALNERLMRTRMQPLRGQLGALRRRVEESAARAGKQLTLRAGAGDVHLEPEKLAVLMPVLGNLLEEVVRRGVERPHERVLVGKPPGCVVSIDFNRRGADLELELRADCPPPPIDSVAPLEPELAPLGARLDFRAGGATTRCTLRLPLAPRVSAVLLVETGGETLALPLGEVDAVVQADPDSLSGGDYEHGGERYALAVLADLLGFDTSGEASSDRASRVPLVLVSAEGARRALAVERIGDRVDVVVQSVGPQLRALSGLAGASILGDGAVVLLLDVTWLVRVSKPCEASV